MKFEFVYEECEHSLPELMKINEYFSECFDSEIHEKKLEGGFKKSYKKSSHFAFSRLRADLQQLNENKEKVDTRIHYNMALIVICHLINHIFEKG